MNEMVSPDGAFETLADRRRRSVLHCLTEYENPMALADLAEEVAASENDAPVDEIGAEEVESVYVSLYHVHVPKLEDAAVVRYDPDEDTVRLVEDTELLDVLDELLAVFHGRDGRS